MAYGISKDEVERLIEQQNNCCSICGNVFVDGDKRGTHGMCIDHCHSTQKIRGLLCSGCNKGLGLFKDNIDSLKKAIEYLK